MDTSAAAPAAAPAAARALPALPALPQPQPPPAAAQPAAAAATAAEPSPDLGDVPLIFQCKSCRALVGDTTAWWCALKDQRPGFALFAQHRNVQVGTLTAAPECTYRDMACALCQAKLGQYIEVPPKDEPTLGRKYVYHLDCVSIAGLGGYVAEPEHEFSRASLSAVPAPAATSEELHLMTYGIKELNKKVDYIIAKYVSKSHARHKQRVEAAVLAAGSGSGASAFAPPQQQQQQQQVHPQSASTATSRRSSAASTTMANGAPALTFAATATQSALPPGTTLSRDQLSQFHARQSASSSSAAQGTRSAPRSALSNGAASTAMHPPSAPSSAAPAPSSNQMLHHFASAPSASASSTPPPPATATLAPAGHSYASIYRPSPTPSAGSHLNYAPSVPFPGFPPGASSTAAAAAAAAAAGLAHQQHAAQQAAAAAYLAHAARTQHVPHQLAGVPAPAPAPGGAGPATKRLKTGMTSAVATARGAPPGQGGSAGGEGAGAARKVPQASAATLAANLGAAALRAGVAQAAGAPGAAPSAQGPPGSVPGPHLHPQPDPPAPEAAGPVKKAVELVTIDDDDD